MKNPSADSSSSRQARIEVPAGMVLRGRAYRPLFLGGRRAAAQQCLEAEGRRGGRAADDLTGFQRAVNAHLRLVQMDARGLVVRAAPDGGDPSLELAELVPGQHLGIFGRTGGRA